MSDSCDPFEVIRRAHLRRSEPVILATVSGIATTNPGMIEWFARQTVASIITTKSIQVHPNPGNREPVITEPEPGSFGNAVGLRNPGLATAKREFAALQLTRRDTAGEASTRGTPLLNISIAGRDAAEFALLAEELGPLADMLELNLSCPHAHGGYGSVIGCDPHLVESITRAAVDAAGRTPVFAKLTPNVADIGSIARKALEGGAAGIVAINTVGPEQYREPHSGEIILTNPAPTCSSTTDRASLTGRGGRSGRWIQVRALECVREIREALGPAVPIVGMGGVERPEDARAMREAGADVVGIGSALALIHQKEWPLMFSTIADPQPRKDDPAQRARYRQQADMRFSRRTVRQRREHGGGLFELELSGSLRFQAGQTAFLWIPGVGEKPFSPALEDPLTFLVRRRGPVTDALGELKPGDPVFVRGPYGSGCGVVGTVDLDPAISANSATTVPPTALILAAGSGTALVPRLARTLHHAGGPVSVYLGLRDDTTGIPLEKAIRCHADLHVVPDEGVTGRVLQVLESCRAVRAHSIDTLWAIGPEPFMEQAAALGRRLGVAPGRIRLSLEKEMLCGVGLCGMCHQGGRLTCQHGTFVEEEEEP